jgi:hypothetical protein
MRTRSLKQDFEFEVGSYAFDQTTACFDYPIAVETHVTNEPAQRATAA